MNKRKKNRQICPKTKSKGGTSAKSDGKNICSSTEISCASNSSSPSCSYSSMISEPYLLGTKSSIIHPYLNAASETCSIDSKISDSELLVISSDTDENDDLKANLPSNLPENNFSEFVKNDPFDLFRENFDLSESDLNFDGIASMSESEISVDQIVINKESEIFLSKDSIANSETESLCLNLTNMVNSNLCVDQKILLNQLNLRPILNSVDGFTNCTHCFRFGVDINSLKDAFDFYVLKSSLQCASVNKTAINLKNSPSYTKNNFKLNNIRSSTKGQGNENLILFQSYGYETSKYNEENLIADILSKKRTPMVVLEKLCLGNNIDIDARAAKNSTCSTVDGKNDIPTYSPRKKESIKIKEKVTHNMTSESVIDVTLPVNKQIPKSNLELKQFKNAENDPFEKTPDKTYAIQISPEIHLAKLQNESPKNNKKSTCKFIHEKSDNPTEVMHKTKSSLPMNCSSDLNQNCNDSNELSKAVFSDYQSSCRKGNVNTTLVKKMKKDKHIKLPQTNQKCQNKFASKTSEISLNTACEKSDLSPVYSLADLSQIFDKSSGPTHLDDITISLNNNSRKVVFKESVIPGLEEKLTDELGDTSVLQNKKKKTVFKKTENKKCSVSSENASPVNNSVDVGQITDKTLDPTHLEDITTSLNNYSLKKVFNESVSGRLEEDLNHDIGDISAQQNKKNITFLKKSKNKICNASSVNNLVDLCPIAVKSLEPIHTSDNTIDLNNSPKKVLSESVSAMLEEKLSGELEDTSVQQNTKSVKVLNKSENKMCSAPSVNSSNDLSQKVLKQNSMMNGKEFKNFSFTVQANSNKRKVNSGEKNVNNNLEICAEKINSNILNDVLSSQIKKKAKKEKPNKINGRIAEHSLQKQNTMESTELQVSSPDRQSISPPINNPPLATQENFQDDAADELLELHLQDDDAVLEDFPMEDSSQPASSSSQSVTSDAHSGNDFIKLTEPQEDVTATWMSYQNDSIDDYKKYPLSEDSGSDSDDHFKRFKRQSPSAKKNISLDCSYVPDIRNLEESLHDLCKKGALQKAIDLAGRYLPISTLEIKEEIFLKLSVCIFNSFNVTNSTSLDKWPIMENIMDLVEKYDLYTTNICSTVICYCHTESEMYIYTEKMFDICNQKNRPLNNEAVRAFGKYLSSQLSIPKRMSKFLSFLEYVKNVCNRSIPTDFLHIMLKWSLTAENVYEYFDQICSFLPGLNENEMDVFLLQKFLKFCIKKEWWQYIAKSFHHWVEDQKKILLHSLFQALAAQFNECGENLFKFATSVCGTPGQLPLNHLNVFGQILTVFMLEAYDQQKFDLAFDILLTLHKQNINYYELQLSFASSFSSEGSFMRKSPTVDCFVFPQTTCLAAVDICLQLKRPKDAYELFRAFSWIKLKDIENSELLLQLFQKKFKCFTKLVRLLINVHFLKGFDAFINLFKNIESESFEVLGHFKGELDNLFNEYLTNLLNTNEGDKALHLYEYGSEHCKGMLNVERDNLRGLLVKLTQKGKMEKAKNFFHLGQLKKVYVIEKPQMPWTLTILSSWTQCEIKFAFEFFFQSLAPLLKDKPPKKEFEEWFQVKIIIKEQDDIVSVVDCLRESPNKVDSAFNKISRVVRTIDPNLKVEEIPFKNALLIDAKTFYDFWTIRCCSSPSAKLAESFRIQGQKGISFGKERTPRSSIESNSSEKFIRLSSPLISPGMGETVLQRRESSKSLEPSPKKCEMLPKSPLIKITSPQQSLNKYLLDQNAFRVGNEHSILDSVIDSNSASKMLKKDDVRNFENFVEKTHLKSELHEMNEKTASDCEKCIQEAKHPPVKWTSISSCIGDSSDKNLSDNSNSSSFVNIDPPKPKKKLIRHDVGIKFINSRPTSPARFKKIAQSPIVKKAKSCLNKAKVFKLPPSRTNSNFFESYTISLTESACRNVIANDKSDIQLNKVQKQIGPLWRMSTPRKTVPAINHTQYEEMQVPCFSVSPLSTGDVNKSKEYVRIKNFLESKLLLRHRSLPAEEIDQRAQRLAVNFMSQYAIVSTLDRTDLKHLNEFAEKII